MKSRLYLLGAAALFSTGGAVVKASALSSWQVAGFRSAVAAIALTVLVPESRRNWSRYSWLTGVAYALTLILFVLATRLTTSANAIFLQSTAPLYLLILGPWLLHEPVRRIDLLTMGVVAAGMTLFFFGSESSTVTAPNPLQGNLLGAASGITWALTVTGLRSLGKRTGAQSTIVAGNLLACLLCLPAALPVASLSLRDAAIILYLGVFQIGLAYTWLTRGLAGCPALPAAMVLLLEPALNPVWTWLFHGERPSPLAVLGGVLILLAPFLPRLLTAPD